MERFYINSHSKIKRVEFLVIFKIKEVPIKYRKRIGSSKISGRSITSIKAVIVITFSILKYMIKTGNGLINVKKVNS
jgi:hypothetical protein